MKKVLVSSALSALLVLPAAALEIYSDDGKSVELYGSIRGYVGMGENAHKGEAGGPANFLFGVQGNSHVGFNVSVDKFKAKVEFGAKEDLVTGGSALGYNELPLRFFWGSYDTGAGTILIGKANTPTTDIFSTGVLNTDTAFNGFGGLSTSTRRLQAQYNIAGLSLALISDYMAENVGVIATSTADSSMPRIALSYTINGDKAPLFQIAGTYRHYTSETWTGNVTGNNGGSKAGDNNNAWHISVGTKPTFGNSFVSLFGFYGKNQHFYGETGTFYNPGLFNHIGALATEDSVKRAGGHAELGIGLSKDANLTFGLGYQETFGDITGKYKSWAAFVQLPYKVSANFTLTPVVGWFQTAGVKEAVVTENNDKVTSVVAAARVMWNF